MKFKNNFFRNYLCHAPTPLALERSLECELLSQEKFNHPILDIGCGEGLFAFILFQEKIDTGVDPDEKELKRAGQYGMYDELIKCYGQQIPKEDKTFNTIFSNSVLEHIPEIEKVLKEVHRLLTNEGSFYITVPTNLFDHYTVLYRVLLVLRIKSAERYRLFFNKFWKHYHYYDEYGWEKLLNRNGFQVIRVKEYGTKNICLFDDFLTPFSFLSFIKKKMFNRWMIFPLLRGITTAPLRLFVSKKTIKQAIEINKGGLIFFHLKKMKYEN